MLSSPESLASVTTLHEIPQTSSWNKTKHTARNRKTVPKFHPPQSPTPKRSTVTSVCIVAACTSSLMMSVALGPSVSVLLPYAGKDLHIQQEDLQWIVNAYSLSSVNNFVHERLTLAMCTGMFPPSLGPSSRPLRSKTSVDSRILHFVCIRCLRWVRPMYVPSDPSNPEYESLTRRYVQLALSSKSCEGYKG